MKSLLFVPGSQKERFSKALQAGASGVIIDLEDAVADKDKAQARDNILSFYNTGVSFYVRVNAATSPFFAEDLKLLQSMPKLAGVMLPKTEYAIHTNGLSFFNVFPLIESARGVYNMDEIAACTCVKALLLGGLDMATDLHLQDGEGSEFMLNYIRAQMVMLSTLHNLQAPIDGVFPDMQDGVGLQKTAMFAKSMGFGGSLCIHPKQVAVINDVFRPTEKEIAWAREVLRLAKMHHNAAFQLDGAMVDLPLIIKAQRILADNE